ncbi:MAG: hypothetical protein ACI4TL_05900 [Candidatus Cryptobacteroides sp.]
MKKSDFIRLVVISHNEDSFWSKLASNSITVLYVPNSESYSALWHIA